MVKKTDTLGKDIPEFPTDDITARPKPEMISEPLLVKSVVSFKVTVPLVQYGNIEMFSSQEFYTQADEPDSKREVLRATLLDTMRKQMAELVLPLMEEEVKRAKPALVKEAYPDAWMQRTIPAYRWLRVAAPELSVEAMDEIVASRA